MSKENLASGNDFFSNFDGFLKKFKISSVNEKDQEVLTLSNLDSGYIRKFIIKKVDESALFGRRNSQKSLKDGNKSNKSSRNPSLKKAKNEKKRRFSNASLKAICGVKKGSGGSFSNGNLQTSKSDSDLKKKKKKRRKSIGSAIFKIGGSDSEQEDSDVFLEDFSTMTAKDKDDKDKPEFINPKENEEKEVVNPGFINDAFIKDVEEDEGIGGLGKDEKDDKEILLRDRTEADGISGSDSISSLDSNSPSGSPRFNLRMSPRPKKKRSKSDTNHSPVPSIRSGYQSNRSSISSNRKGILKKTISCTTINMEMGNLSRPQTPTENMDDDDNSTAGSPKFVRTQTLTHQRSFNRVKFILDSGKPDNVSGDYDDIKIEKIERDHRNSTTTDRNTKPADVGSSGGLSKSGKKCLVFSAGVLVVTMAVILGSFFGSRKSGLVHPKSLPSATENFNKRIEGAAEGRFRIINENFLPFMYNFESPKFREMSSSLQEAMLKAIFEEELANKPNSTSIIRIVKYEEGSVISVFRIRWSKDLRLTISDIRKKAIKQIIKYGAFGQYKVEKSSFSLSELRDLCDANLEPCSHLCVLSDETLRFGCTCPDSLILVNNTNCISPKLTTTTAKNPVLIPPVVNKVLKISNAELFAVNQETVDKSEDSGDFGSKDKPKMPEKSEVKSTTKDRDKVKSTTIPTVALNTTNKTASVTQSDVGQTIPKEKETIVTKVPSHEDSDGIKINTTTSSTPQEKTVMETSTKMDIHKVEEHKNVTSINTEETKEAALAQPNGNESTTHDAVLNNKTLITTEGAPVSRHSEDNTITDVHSVNTVIDSEADMKKDLHTDIIDRTSNSTIDISAKSKEENSTFNTKSVVTTTISSIASLTSPLEDSETSDESNVTASSVDKSVAVTENTVEHNTSVNPSNVEILNDTKLTQGTQTTVDNKSGSYDSIKEQTANHVPSEPHNLTLQSTTMLPIVHVLFNATSSDNQLTTSPLSNKISSEISTVKSLTFGHDVFVTVEGVDPDTSRVPQTKPPERNDSYITVPSVNTTDMSKTSGSFSMDSPDTTVHNFQNKTITNKKIPSKVDDVVDNVSNSQISTEMPQISEVKQNSSKVERHLIQTEPAFNSSILSFSSNTSLVNNSSDLSNEFSVQKTMVDNHLDSNISHHAVTKTEFNGNLSSSIPTTPSLPINFTISHTQDTTCNDGNQFRCFKDGSCIPKYSRCDSVTDCSDQSDETDCVENRCIDNYQCRWSGDCLSRAFVCDGIKHCTDGDDEEGCETWKCKEDEFRCPPGSGLTCISEMLKCDGHSDCLNGTDEHHCSSDECSKDDFLCPEGKCIPKLWKCDQKRDCLGGEDEVDCDCVDLDQSKCSVGGCVPTFKLCDGLRHCPDGSDEWGCLKIENETRLLQVRSSEGSWSAVCGDKWTSQWTDLVCEQLGLGISLSTEVRRISETVPRPRVKLSPDAPEVSRRGRAPLQYFLTHGDCATDPLVHISCKMPSCGEWQSEAPEMLSNGETTTKSNVWPSLGILIQPETYQDEEDVLKNSCSASILTPSWVVTSFSCLASKSHGLLPEKWALLIGESIPKAGMGNTQLRHARLVVRYPGAKRINGLWVGDAALLKLRTPLTLENTVQPICISEAPPKSHDLCVIASWKATVSKVGEESEYKLNQSIQYLPVPNLTVNTCNTSYYGGKLTREHVCASFLQDKHSSCSGKEGSPLMCKTKSGVWLIHGLLSYNGHCASFNLPSIFTDISKLRSWILSTVGRSNSTEEFSGTATTNTSSSRISSTTSSIIMTSSPLPTHETENGVIKLTASARSLSPSVVSKDKDTSDQDLQPLAEVDIATNESD